MKIKVMVILGAEAKTESKNLEVMRKFSEQYAKRYGASCYRLSGVEQTNYQDSLCSLGFCCRSGTYFCVDKSVTAVVIQGLAEHKDTLGAPLCPCRHYDDKEAEAAQGYWNCPCVPMRERKVLYWWFWSETRMSVSCLYLCEVCADVQFLWQGK